VDLSVLELVFILSVEDEAVFIEEAHNWGLPPGRPQEINDDIKEPVL
jgi:hypothetical protein